MVITSRETRCTFTFYYILFIALLYSYIIVQMFHTTSALARVIIYIGYIVKNNFSSVCEVACDRYNYYNIL